MKKGLNAWVFNKSLSLYENFIITKDAGYDSVELNLAASGEFSMESSDADIRVIRAYADKIGLDLPCVCTSLYWQYSLTSPDAERRKTAENILQRQIDIAEILGAQHILCIPGSVGVDLNLDSMFDDLFNLPQDTRNEVVDYKEAYDISCETLERMAHYARARNVIICVENVGNKYLLSPLEMARFIDEIGSKWVRAYFDVGNVFRIGYPEHWINALGNRIAMVHLKDWSKRHASFVKLGDGDTDFTSLISVLRNVRYDGYLTVEYIGQGDYNRQELIYDTAKFLEKIIEAR